jgi:L-fuculose-phosphate aldolase
MPDVPRTSLEQAARADLVAVGREVARRGLTPGRSGNLSVRWNDGMLITPSGIAYDALRPDDIVHVQGDGGVPEGQRAPSSEWHLHLAIYQRRTDRHAVVHTHSLHATVLACAHRPIPALHYMVAAAGGIDIPCVAYATFGNEALARLVAEALADRDACLMANHGQTAIGVTLAKAFELAADVEVLAEQYVKALAIGGPQLLTTEQMAEAVARFATYGQRRDPV